jgi:ABC-type transport system involved in multi-copper enzyme maturation permease subunit
MPSFRNINTVARFESKTLMRSWFLRIFAIIALLVLLFFNIALSQQDFSPRIFRGLPTNIPYATLLIFNVIQAIIAVFLATDFMKRDKKQDTAEVIFVRPISNGEYIWGKIYGNIRVFLALNVIILIIPFIFTLVTSDMTFDPLGYGLYFALISVPTLVFIFGLSFFMMALIRNQAVVLLVLLGYIALTLFYLSDKLYYLFDYMSFNIPMIWSEFTGLPNSTRLLLHKGLYISLGIALIFFTVLLMKRLRQSHSNYAFSLTGGILFLGIAAFLAGNHVDRELDLRRFRENLISLNDQYLQKNPPTVGNYNLELQHKGQQVKMKAEMMVHNRRPKALDTLIFSLNPGFEVTSCKVNSQEAPYIRKEHLLIIEKELSAGDSLGVALQYTGRPDERVCYLEVPNRILFRGENLTLFRIPKKFSFITSDYLMFTPELLWYPRPGTGFSSKNVAGFRKNFARYKLNVTPSSEMTVLSQGKARRDGHQWIFQPEQPLSCMSVVAGDYQRDSLTVKDITYNIYHKQGHDFYRGFFTDIRDTIPSILEGVMEDYESELHLDYPFDELSIVEVPAHFYTYKKNFTLASEGSLPEMVLMKERAYTLNGADFGRAIKRFQRRRETDQTPEQMKADLFRRFIHSNFIEGEDFRMGWFGSNDVSGNTKIFPNFVSYCNDFGLQEMPVMNPVLERYIENRSAGEDRRRFFRNDGIGDKERANLLLQEQSFAELMGDTSHFVRLSDVIDVKGEYFIDLMKYYSGSNDFDEVLDSFIVATRYRNNTGEMFLDFMKDRYQVNTREHMNNWLYANEVPGFTFRDVKAFSYYRNENLRYQAEITITNTGNTMGMVKLNMRIGQRRNSSLSEEKTVILHPGRSKRVGLTVGETPSMLMANTLVSSNLPSTLRFPLRDIEEDEKADGGEFVRETQPPSDDKGTIIVDNESPSFRLITPEKATKLRDLINNNEEEKEYTDVSPWRPPDEWQKAIDNKFYGDVKLSAAYVRSGNGEQKAIWMVPIDQAGHYEVQAYVSNAGLRPRWRRRDENENEKKIYRYTIFHDDGEEEAEVNVKDYRGDWVSLGQFYFSPDTARVQISNESNARSVVADAIKFIRK